MLVWMLLYKQTRGLQSQYVYWMGSVRTYTWVREAEARSELGEHDPL